MKKNETKQINNKHKSFVDIFGVAREFCWEKNEEEVFDFFFYCWVLWAKKILNHKPLKREPIEIFKRV
jgi:hypothetical protein